MAKIPVKKTTVSKKKTSTAKAAPKTKKAIVKKGSVRSKSAVSPKKEISEEERAIRAANLIENLEKKKKKEPRVKKTTAKKTLSLLDAVVEGMREKKAKNIMVLDLRKIENRVTDYFVIGDAESNVHVNSIAEGVEEFTEKKSGEIPYHTEGRQNGEWILVDYVDVVAHVFLKEFRDLYNIEALWGDADITLVND
jgi:ribosome-associated protein